MNEAVNSSNLAADQEGASAPTIVPANEASWDDIRAVFGTHGEPAGCACQWLKFERRDWRALSRQQRTELLREQTNCDHPEASTTSGLVAYLGDTPAGWCAVEPRSEYVRLLSARIPWAGRDESKDDDSVWAVTCFVTRVGFRRRGVGRALAEATVSYAKERGASAVEGYPIVVEPDQEFTWGELFVGSWTMFADAGYREVSRPTARRAVMRIDF